MLNILNLIKLKKDDLIIVKDEGEYLTRHFSHFKDGKVYYFYGGFNSKNARVCDLCDADANNVILI